ncbi:hypothetical protein [Streptomyces sp. Ag109_O5-1]|uniref:hypothetical protein n=1 Tax=Streptomyces sp. Ag109_O5-1 TaxID=1938851 RepID=UPI001624EF7F|nr:hypothetical protein [Streptomyces sp. Ag109_O5-1]
MMPGRPLGHARAVPVPGHGDGRRDRPRAERGEGAVDWVMLAPAGFLGHGGEHTGRYRVGGERVPGGEPRLSYADLAVAVVDEIERPLRHRERVSVFGFR